MALSLLAGNAREEDPWEWPYSPGYPSQRVLGLSMPSAIGGGGVWDWSLARPEHTKVARDVASVANTQVDWRETPYAHIFKANLPGVRKEDVKVEVEDGRVLQISGEREREEVEDSERWHRLERAHASFLRRFRLPDNALLDQVSANMEHGVLTVTVPKSDQVPRILKTIDIQPA